MIATGDHRGRLSTDLAHLVPALTARLPDLLADLQTLVIAESPTADLAAVATCADLMAHIGTRLTGEAPRRTVNAGRTHLRWRFGAGDRVLLLGHLDTVWPRGSLADHPWSATGGRVTGPGCFDMKAGLVVLFYALAELRVLDGVSVLVTGDEEIGSPTSHDLIREEALGTRAVLVLEGSERGALKIERKGVSSYQVAVRGRAAHAGLEPERGANATVELAHQILELAGLGDKAAGTTVTPTLASGGTTINTVPDGARVSIDVRARSAAEQDRVDRAVRALRPQVPGTELEVTRIATRPPLPRTASAELFARARRIGVEIGLGELRGVAVGGGSDGNITASAGTPTLDGLGAVGGGAHAPGEHVLIDELPRRAALLSALVGDLLVDAARPDSLG